MPRNAPKRSKANWRPSNRGATQGDGPSYSGQPIVRLRVPALVGLPATVVTTGLIASSSAIGSAAVTGFATRFGSTFDEYRITGADVLVRPLSISTGISNFWFDEKSSTTPVLLDALERVQVRASNNSADEKSSFTMRWRARDLVDLTYSPIGTPTTPVYFKVYTDNTTFASPIVTTQLWVLEYRLHVEFRGLKAA